MRKMLIAAAIAVCAAFAAPAFADDFATRDLSVQQTTALHAGQASPGSLRVAAWFDRASLTYAVGERVRIFVDTNEDAYVTVLNIGPSGEVTQLYPTAFQPDNLVRANYPVEIASHGARVTVQGPVGAELIKVIASSTPIHVIPEAQLQMTPNSFPTVNGGVPTLVRNLQITPAAPELKIAITNRVIRTVEAQPTGGVIVVVPSTPAPQTAVVIAPAANPLEQADGTVIGPNGMPSASIAPTAQMLPITGVHNPFPLLIATDRSSYAPYDQMVLAVTSMQQCYLTVFDVNAAGQARVVFPNQINQNNLVGAMQTTLVAGATSKVPLDIRGPAGPEQLVGVCSTDKMPVSSMPLDIGQMFTPAGTIETLSHDLTAAAGRPSGSTALAAVTVAVQP